MFFDERFNFITAADGGLAQQQVASSVTGAGATLGPLNIKAPKNGYVFIYVSNGSDQDVYFDSLNVSIAASNIIEEDHYYAYGLKIAAISSKKLGDTYEGQLKNNNLYNEKELFDDGDLNWYDYGFRNYDPQIGRFMQLDPLTFRYPFYTPYQFAGCEPISNVDLDGLEPAEVTSFANGILKAGGVINRMDVLEIGKWAGKWVVSGGINGVGFSRVFLKTGQLWKNLELATKLLGAAINTISVTNKGLQLSNMQRGDIPSYFGVRSQSQLVLDNYGKTIDLIKDDWHPIDHTMKYFYGLPQGGSINWSTGEIRGASTSIEMTDGPETWIPMIISGAAEAKLGAEVLEEGGQVAIHGNSLMSLRPTWGYKLFSNEGTFLKNGITSKLVPEGRYTKVFMSDKYMEKFPFPNRRVAWDWEFQQNQILRGPLNRNMH